MTEILQIEGDRAYIAMVTMVPAIVNALTGRDASDLNRKAIRRFRLSEAGPFRDACEGAREHVVDLFFVPAINGSFDTRNSSNIGDLSSRLEGYDIVIDLCEMTALYRRGKMTEAFIDDAVQDHPGLGRNSLKNFLDYKNYLELVIALFTLMDTMRGRIMRPRIFDALTYTWAVDRNGDPEIRDFDYLRHAAVLEHWSGGTTNEGWAKLIGDVNPNEFVFNTFGIDDHPALPEALGLLHEQGAATLSQRVMLTDYRSDLAGMIQKLTEDPENNQFTCTLEATFDLRRTKLNVGEFPPNQTAIILDLEEELRDLFAAAHQPIHLIDYFRITGGPSDAPANQELIDSFRMRFKKAFAFLRLWDFVEWENEETELNAKINGWYMANSTYWMLRQAVQVHGLKSPVTSWGTTTLVTNSLGLVPEYEDYIENIVMSVSNELNALVSANIPA